jgi:hypothetical protein
MIAMKNILKALTGSLLMMALFSSCTKDENQVVYEGGTNPVLTASSTTAMILLPANQTNQAIKFTWTNPDYKFNTGISSQDVTYILQVDSAGANFTSPLKQEVSISKELSVTFTVKELNTILTKLNMLENITHNIEFRIKSSLVNGSVPLYSNVIKIVITPYLDVALPIPTTGELYITGDACPSDWTNSPPAAQKCTKLSNTEYTITMAFVSGKYYKFLTTLGFWQPQYGLKPGSGGDASGGDLGLNNQTPAYPSDPDGIPTAAVSGNYKVTLNFKTGKYTVVKL